MRESLPSKYFSKKVFGFLLLIALLIPLGLAVRHQVKKTYCEQKAKKIKEQISQLVENSKSCVKSEDCKIYEGLNGSEFPIHESVHASFNSTEIEKIVEAYEKGCYPYTKEIYADFFESKLPICKDGKCSTFNQPLGTHKYSLFIR